MCNRHEEKSDSIKSDGTHNDGEKEVDDSKVDLNTLLEQNVKEDIEDTVIVGNTEEKCVEKGCATAT